MKKINLLNMLLTAIIGVAMFTSCEDSDTMQSMALSGQWRGDFGMFYEYEYHGRYYTFDADYTDIVFYPDYDYASHGWGKQVDYYYDGPYEYQYYRFYWTIDQGIVYLRYPSDPTLSAVISEYRMNNDRFSGWFEGSTASFSLYKIADYYDWTPYVDVYGYGLNNGWHPAYYVDSRAAETDSLTVPFDASEGRVVRRGNRFTMATQRQ